MLRRFAGPVADEVAILCRPDGRSRHAAREAEAAYRSLVDALATQHASFRDLVGETLFLRDIRRDLPAILDARARVLTAIGQSGDAPLPAFIEQAPVAGPAALELLATAVVPRDRNAWSVRDVRARPSCPCGGCARSGARLIHLGDETSLATANLYGVGGSATEEALDMFREAERLLEQCGMSFRDVVRTWVHLRDVDRDYDALNAARREFFERCGIDPRPASTGVAGGPSPEAHDFSLRLHAVKAPRPLEVAGMSTPLLNEAWSYGADFSRGMRLVEANKIALHVSGTASVDQHGRTIHVGDFEAQAERMMDNIASLLEREGTDFTSLVSGIVYVKHASDAPVLRSVLERRGFDGFPCALVEAGLCRPNLLCEAEAVAMLPRKSGSGAP